jgi:hypothetical protein
MSALRDDEPHFELVPEEDLPDDSGPDEPSVGREEYEEPDEETE